MRTKESIEQSRKLIKLSSMEEAHTAYKLGIPLYVVPCAIRVDNPWAAPYEIVRNLESKFDIFDVIIHTFERLNCGVTTGDHADFYIKEENICSIC